jgi:hypothetical protein
MRAALCKKDAQPACAPAIFSQDSAHRAHSSAHSFISGPSRARQDSSQVRHTTAQTPHVSVCSDEFLSMKFALVRQISAQSSIVVMCDGSAWAPPILRQCSIIAVHSSAHEVQASIQSRISGLIEPWAS